MGGEGRLRLVGHVLLAAEGPSVRHQLDSDQGGVDTEYRGHLVAVIPHALAPRIEHQPPAAHRYHQRRLGFQEGMLHPLGHEGLVHLVRRRRVGGLEIAPGVLGDRKDVAV